ncbi:MAG: hypothetical protein HY298_01645 [Verrucomicrobia bacterium]|nr:hypothetical protein [Verrucomicrobiota bacterium]
MRVVSDTSPVSNLAIIGRLDFLRRRYGEISIPSAVRQELAYETHEADYFFVSKTIRITSFFRRNM